MPFTHHSHSGQFCGHAVNTLQEMVERAIALKLTTFCMTEHMPRQEIDFYPEESTVHTEASLQQLFGDYHREARRLQKVYADKIQILVGFEGEWIRDSSLQLIKSALEKYPVDLFMGSIHHVHTIPIDHDSALYRKARDLAGGTEERIFEDYFDSQYEMLQALKPPVVGHFDLIRLNSEDPERSFQNWPGVWSKIDRNLSFIVNYGGVLELNSSALRKGMSEAYPRVEICQAFKEKGGRFTLSDDSHGIDHVATNYHKMFEKNITQAGITDLVYLTPTSDSTKLHDSRFPHVCWAAVPVATLKEHPFFLA